MKMLKRFKQFTFRLIGLSSAIFFVATPNSFAYGGSGIPSIDNALNAIVDFLTLDIIRIIAVLGIVGIGYATLELGKIPKSKAIYSCIGIGMVMGAGIIGQKLGFGG